jgi:hypothetical protein
MRCLATLVLLAGLTGCTDSPEDTGAKSQEPVGACDGLVTTEHNTTANHVEPGTDVEWTNNPPTSGPHYPVWARWDREYPTLARGYWVHNLEHGGIVLLYNCADGCPDVVEQLRNVARNMEPDATCTSPITKRVVITSDPLLPEGVQIAAVAWNAAYTASCYDPYIDRFAGVYYRHAPEDFCNEGANVASGTPISP